MPEANLSEYWSVVKALEKRFNSNGLLVKELIKFAGLLISKDSVDVECFEYLCRKYSSSDEMDYLRIAVILAFKLCMEKLLVVLASSHSSSGFSMYLSFCNSFMRLL